MRAALHPSSSRNHKHKANRVFMCLLNKNVNLLESKAGHKVSEASLRPPRSALSAPVSPVPGGRKVHSEGTAEGSWRGPLHTCSSRSPRDAEMCVQTEPVVRVTHPGSVCFITATSCWDFRNFFFFLLLHRLCKIHLEQKLW